MFKDSFYMDLVLNYHTKLFAILDTVEQNDLKDFIKIEKSAEGIDYLVHYKPITITRYHRIESVIEVAVAKNNTVALEKLLDFLDVPNYNMTLNERIVYYQLFNKGN